MAYIGNPIYQAAFVTDQFSGDGTTTAFTMSVAPAGTSNVLVVVSGVVQDPSTYGVVGTTLTFTGAPPSGTGNISCRYLGVPVTGITTTAYRTVTEFTATAGQTTFTPASYNVGFINVYRNGALLGTADYTATNGTTVVLAVGATVGDLVVVESFLISSVSNAISNTAGSVSSSNIIDGGVTTAKIADDAVDLTTKVTGVLPEANGGTGTTTGYYGFKNRIINGAMMIDQRNAGASVTITGSNYTLDRWLAFASVASKFSVQQSSTAPDGFTKSLLCTSLSAYSIGASEICTLNHIVEGYNIADLGFGTSSAKSFTFSFWVRSSLTGTFSTFFANSGQSRWYVAPFTINAANTWEYKTINVAGDTSGTWLTTNGAGLYASFQLSVGSDYLTTASTGWAGGSTKYGITGQQSLVGTNGATFYITGVQLEVGTAATNFDFRSYGTELSLCERYYQILGIYGAISPTATSSAVYYQIPIRTVMRTTPTATFGNSTFNRMTNYGVLDYSGTYTPSINDYAINSIAYRVNVTSGSSWSANIPMAVNPTTQSHAVLLVTAEL